MELRYNFKMLSARQRFYGVCVPRASFSELLLIASSAVNDDLKSELATERASHNDVRSLLPPDPPPRSRPIITQVLESASNTATLLQERIEILQFALNDPPPSHQTDSKPDDSIWHEIVDSQSEVRPSLPSLPH